MQRDLFDSSDSAERHFLGWDRPLIPAAAAWLGRYETDNVLDLRGVIVVLPTRRGVRRLKSQLERWADAGGGQVRWGWVGTVGSMPEQLYDLSEVCGETVRGLTSLQRTLYWADVVRETPPEKLASLVGRVPPPDSTDSRASGSWMAIASTLDRLTTDLASADVSFDQLASALENESERNRWNLLGELTSRYESRLESTNRTDVHRARRRAIDQSALRHDRDIILVGCTDLSAAVTTIVSKCTADVHALISAPASAADRFDPFGNVDRAAWAVADIEIQGDDLVAAGDSAEQAETAAAILHRWAEEDSISPADVTVGATDESMTAIIEFSINGRGRPTFRNQGYAVAETAVGRLITLLGKHVSGRSWETLAALIRHPDILATLGGDGESHLAKLDQMRSETYAVSIDAELSDHTRQQHAPALAMAQAVDQMIASINQPAGTLSTRCRFISDWLANLYAIGNPGDAGDLVNLVDAASADEPLHPRTTAAAESMIRWLGEHREIDTSIDPELSVSAMMDLMVEATRTLRIADQSGEDDTDLLGWLDLAFDDAPAMVVVGLNHPFVPESVTADPFLPGSLRSRFRIADNERRYARDAHALQCIVACRSHVKLIVGRTSADGSPTPPSRLIAAAPAGEVAERIGSLLGGSTVIDVPPHRWDRHGMAGAGGMDAGQITLPPDLTRLPPAGVRRMSVTSFKNYLICPYRFYLRHVLHLKPIDDSGGELAANQFGDLVHNSLEIWGLGDDRDETRPDRIEAAMHTALEQYAGNLYGKSATAAVQLQVHQARQKLSRVARVQAERIAEGWRVDRVEASVNEDIAAIEVDGFRMGLRGRFDRIDVHDATGRYAILDYKTHGHRPEKKHIEKDQWVDLQLPLYRRMIPFLGIDADPSDVDVGYFNIADKEEETRINLAPFTDQQWASADALIDEIVRGIRDERFDPAEQPPTYDDYDMILGLGVHDQPAADGLPVDGISADEISAGGVSS